MRVLVVSDVLGEENNGTTIAAMNLIRSLQNKGHEVRILCCDANRKGQPGYYVVPVKSFGILNGYVKRNGVVLAKVDLEVLRQAIKNVDIVHSILPFALGQEVVREAKKLNIPVTSGFHAQAENLTSHVYLKNFALANWGVYKFLYRKYYSKVNAIHYPTQFIRDVFETTNGLTNGYVISNGVNLAFGPKPADYKRDQQFDGKYVILTTGRYAREKRQDVLINAVRRSKYRDRIQIIVAGSGPLEKKLRKLGSKLPNPPIFKFVSRDQMVNLIYSADLYVHPADIEIESIACLEAISGGLTPLISNSKRSAARYFGLSQMNRFKNNNVKDLARRIDFWIEHPEQKKQNARLYKGFADKFAFDYCMDEMERMLLETLEIHQTKFPL